MGSPRVSFVVPAKDEAAYVGETLSSIRRQETAACHELVVVDGDSDDATPEIAREHGARVVAGEGEGIARGRHLGAEAAEGTWLAFVDADTVVRPEYLEEMLSFVRERDLTAASSRCRVVGPYRAKAIEWTINHVFPRLGRPILPGFNLFVERSSYFEAGGFPAVPNEDTAFSRKLARTEPVEYHPEVLVESSGRRVNEAGLTGTAVHYLRLDARRLAAEY